MRRLLVAAALIALTGLAACSPGGEASKDGVAAEPANNVTADAGASSGAPAAPQAPTVTYACDGGLSVSARYLGNDSDAPSVELALRGQTHRLASVVSGSGARYSATVRPGWVIGWDIKADTALLSEGPANAPDQSTIACREAGSATSASEPEPGAEPAESLAFEWSANGFEQMPAQYRWAGSGRHEDGLTPYFSLSVPETDDVVWSSDCAAGGKVRTMIYFQPPEGLTGGSATLRFETDRSTATLSRPVRYIATGQADGFELVLGRNDMLFDELRTGRWAYVQIGEGAAATKRRISLAGAGEALDSFLSGCGRGG